MIGTDPRRSHAAERTIVLARRIESVKTPPPLPGRHSFHARSHGLAPVATTRHPSGAKQVGCDDASGISPIRGHVTVGDGRWWGSSRHPTFRPLTTPGCGTGMRPSASGGRGRPVEATASSHGAWSESACGVAEDQGTAPESRAAAGMIPRPRYPVRSRPGTRAPRPDRRSDGGAASWHERIYRCPRFGRSRRHRGWIAGGFSRC